MEGPSPCNRLSVFANPKFSIQGGDKSPISSKGTSPILQTNRNSKFQSIENNNLYTKEANK